ncbi:hypothetical protein KFE25_003310 [Diacronema lutheri]|uniref:Hexosyltransferase n=2 Tax=Diacronema lutheri TaxID=2081491 RepID=A0A8J5XHR8_DIALT|nr:hypothetical protein KFE25_003310 [Diacronema lutheri]
MRTWAVALAALARVGALRPAAERPCAMIVDVVLMSNHVSCIVNSTIASLIRLHSPRPRTVHVVVPDALVGACTAQLGAVARCHAEHALVGLSKDEVVSILIAKGERWLQKARSVRKRALWFYQQVVKLTLPLSLRSLSRHFLVWDADQLLARPYASCIDGHVRIDYVSTVDKHTARNTHYESTTRALLGYVSPPPRNWVTHKMYVVQAHARRMLERLCGAAHDASACAAEILRRIPTNADPHLGLSEYDLYAAYMLREAQALVLPQAVRLFRTEPLHKRPAAEICGELNAGLDGFLQRLGGQAAAAAADMIVVESF